MGGGIMSRSCVEAYHQAGALQWWYRAKEASSSHLGLYVNPDYSIFWATDGSFYYRDATGEHAIQAYESDRWYKTCPVKASTYTSTTWPRW